MVLKNNDIVLFQGDSITDTKRDRQDLKSMGSGYAMMASAFYIASTASNCNTSFFNRGIAGNTVSDLRKRWEEDCIELKPTVLSVLIGINETVHKFKNNEPTSAKEFEQDYNFILERTKKMLPDTKIIILEPFYLPAHENSAMWRVDLEAKLQVVKRLAQQFSDAFIPLDTIFSDLCKKTNTVIWAADGIHPTNAGHAVIADRWLKVLAQL